jgi:Co/Zn/Cd efflux system component
MAVHNLASWQHDHAYDTGNRAAERRTWIVVAITAVTMVAEIVAGYLTGSMALTADGWHTLRCWRSWRWRRACGSAGRGSIR